MTSCDFSIATLTVLWESPNPTLYFNAIYYAMYLISLRIIFIIFLTFDMDLLYYAWVKQQKILLLLLFQSPCSFSIVMFAQ